MTWLKEVEERALKDLAAHPGSTTREIGGRIGAEPRLVRVALGVAELAGRARRHAGPYQGKAWRWSLPGTPQEPR